MTGLAVLAGPVLGGAVTQGIAWPWVFWLNVPIGLALIPLIASRIPADARAGAVAGPGSGASLDPGGLILASGAAFGLVWALVRANEAGWGSPAVVAPLAAGAVLAGAFIAWERRAASPMVPLPLFRARAFAAGNAASFAMFGVLVAMVFFMAQFLQIGLGYGPLGAGLRLLPGWATLAVIAPFAGPAVGLGPRPLVAGGLALNAAGLAWIAAIASTGLPYWQLVIPLVMAGTGASLAIPAAASAVMGSVPPPMIGRASGTYNTLRQLGGVFGLAICAAVFAAHGGYASPSEFSAGIGPALGACAGVSAAGAAACSCRAAAAGGAGRRRRPGAGVGGLAGGAVSGPARRPSAPARTGSAGGGPGVPGRQYTCAPAISRDGGGVAVPSTVVPPFWATRARAALFAAGKLSRGADTSARRLACSAG